MSNPLVTVFTFSYHTNAKLVIEAINSIFKTNYPNLQHIIINDAPDDQVNWPKVKRYIEDNHLPSIVIEHSKNMGVCSNLNEVLRFAKGKYFIGCSDDLLDVNAIARLVEFFEAADSTCKIVFGDIEIINDKNEMINQSFFRLHNWDPNDKITFESYLKGTRRFATIGCMYRVDDLKDIGMYDETLESEDIDIHLRLLRYGNALYVGYKVASYRRHAEQISQNFGNRYYDDRIKIYTKHLDISNDIHDYLVNRIQLYAKTSYFFNTKNSFQNLKFAKGLKVNLKISFLFCLAFFNIKSGTLLNLKNVMKLR